jgi:hypothetical protein
MLINTKKKKKFFDYTYLSIMKKLRKNKNMQSVISVNTNILLRRFRLKFLIVSKFEVKGEGNTPLSKFLLEVRANAFFIHTYHPLIQLVLIIVLSLNILI